MQKKNNLALQQSSNYKTIKQRGKKDNPILKLSEASEAIVCFPILVLVRTLCMLSLEAYLVL